MPQRPISYTFLHRFPKIDARIISLWCQNDFLHPDICIEIHNFNVKNNILRKNKSKSFVTQNILVFPGSQRIIYGLIHKIQTLPTCPVLLIMLIQFNVILLLLKKAGSAGITLRNTVRICLIFKDFRKLDPRESHR